MRCQGIKRAFSLLELVVVVVIVSMLASLVGLTLRTHFERAALERARAVASRADHLCRQLAQHRPAGTVELVIDPQGGQLTVRPAGRKFVLPSGARLARVRQHSFHVWSEVQRIEFNTPGVSPSYAMRFEKGDSNLGICFLGLSGQGVSFESAEELQGIFP